MLTADTSASAATNIIPHAFARTVAFSVSVLTMVDVVDVIVVIELSTMLPMTRVCVRYWVTVAPCIVCEDSALLVVDVYRVRSVELVIVVVFIKVNTDVLVTVTVEVDCASTEPSKTSPATTTNSKTSHGN